MPAINPLPAHTEAEAFARRLSDLGVTTYMLVRPDGRALLAFDPLVFPMAPAASELAAQIRRRFLTEPRFARDLLAYLLIAGSSEEHIYMPRPGRNGFTALQPVSR